MRGRATTLALTVAALTAPAAAQDPVFRVRDINPLQAAAEPIPYCEGEPTIAAVGGAVVFTGHSVLTGTELWKTDGTAPGTVLLKDLYPGHSAFEAPREYSVLGGHLYFFGQSRERKISSPESCHSRYIFMMVPICPSAAATPRLNLLIHMGRWVRNRIRSAVVTFDTASVVRMPARFAGRSFATREASRALFRT